MTFQSMNQVQEANRKAGQHFFDPSTMDFFNSRIESALIQHRFFVTSEQGPDGIRAYTVRVVYDSARIGSVGGFQGYATKREAIKAIEAIDGSEYDE